MTIFLLMIVLPFLRILDRVVEGERPTQRSRLGSVRDMRSCISPVTFDLTDVALNLTLGQILQERKQSSDLMSQN
jgi:hypothetical protein